MNVRSEICSHNRCMGCSLCEAVCPSQAITMEYDAEGFIYPVVNDKSYLRKRLEKKNELYM